MGPLRTRKPGNAISSAAPAPEAVEGQRLAAGAACRVYRDGGVMVAQLTVPTVEGAAFLARSLPPGRYEARDELGGVAVFEVPAGAETVVVQPAVDEDADALYGEVARAAEVREDEPAPEAIQPPVEHVDVDPALLGDDAARVPGAAGAAVTVDEEHVPLPDQAEIEARAEAVAALEDAGDDDGE